MKLVAVARVKNELDIIEAFVSHHVHHFDKVVVLDDGSSDGTYQILQKLRSVYRDLVVLRQPSVGYVQDQSMTLLLRMAVDKFGADWVAPLDADEFIEPADGMILAQVLAGRQPAVYALEWSNFVWSPDLAQSDEQNPVLRQRFRLPPRFDLTKLLVHAQFVNGTAELSLGNHFLMDSGRPITTQLLDRVHLCHYPIRGVEQYASKIAVGYLQYLATPDWNRQNGFHYIKPFQELAEFGLHGITKLIRQHSLFYSVEDSEKARDIPRAVEAPLNYLGGPSSLKSTEVFILSNVLRYAELMATEFARKVKRGAQLERELLDSQETAQRQARILSELERELLDSQETAQRQARIFSELERELLDSQEAAQRQARGILELERELLNSQAKVERQARQLSETEIELLNSREKIARQTRQLQSRSFRFLTRVHGMLIRSHILRHRP